MLYVSINGGEKIKVDSIVAYDEQIPIATVALHGGAIVYADSVRDREDFLAVLLKLGIRPNKLHELSGTLKYSNKN